MGTFEIIIVMLLLRIPMHKAKGTEEVFIVTNNYCITNSTSAIAFNPPIESINESEDTSSNFYPRQKKKYICNIEYEEKDGCVQEYTSSRKWELINSLDGEVSDGVLDRRWEELRIYKSKHLENDGETLSYKKIDIEITKKNFVIHFSVRLKNEGHIFLCENEVSNSKCYWIMLQAWKGTHSAIRRCDAGEISSKNGKWPAKPCSIPKKFFNHTEDIISDSFWAHFKITVDNGNITVYRSNEQSQLIGFKDEEPFSPKRIYVHSKKQDGLWKFHKYTYLHTTQLGSSAMGEQFHSKNKCIAFFIAMCENCGLSIQMTDITTAHVYFEDNYATWNEKWKEIKIDFESNETYTMHVTTKLRKQQNNVNNRFWAIDSIRHCEDKEYRILETSIDRAPCQLIENKNSILTTEIDVSDQSTNCPENTFGKKCVPCTAIGGDLCSPLKYCELFDDKRSCHCTSGYYSNSCEACPWKYYGHGCKEQCDNCLYGCNNTDGHCTFGACTDGYKGIKCDEPVTTWLKYAPEVTNITETSCSVYITQYDIIGDRNSINYIRIQYKKNISTYWISRTGKLFPDNQDVEYIDNLEADTTYCVRAQLYSNTFNIYEGSVIKERCFNTICIPFSTEDIHIFTYNTSATIKLAKKSNYSCQISNYKYRLDEREEHDMNEIVSFVNLTPFQNYTFNLRHRTGINISKEFQTSEGVPTKVKNLKIDSSSSTSIFLKWETPSKTNGRVIYNVRYKMKKINCDFTDSDSINVTETKIHLPNVKPYSEYEIEVGAQTRQAAGEYWPINITTTSTETLTRLEYPNIEVMDVSTNNVTVRLKPPNCENVDGPIYINFAAKCSLCDQQIIHNNITISYNVSFTIYTISELHPYTEYILLVSASRNKIKHWTKIKSADFKTKPSVPHKIEKPDIVSKDENSVSLRWKPPFPPTGILALYKIKYDQEEIEKNITECSLWPKYHCATIENMKGNKRYNIELLAKNKKPDVYEIISVVPDVITKTEVPHSPYDVITTWTDNNDLNISWKHPNITNGKVKNFTINIKADETQHFLKEIKSIEDYNLTYSFLIQKENFRKPCRMYTVSVTIYNEKFNNESNIIKETSPPPSPPISNNTIKITNDTNHTIFIEISKLEDDDQSVNYNAMFYILTSTEIENVNSDIKSFEEYLRNNSSRHKFDYVKLFDNNTQKSLPYEKKIDTDKSGDKVKRLYIYFVNECYGKVEIEKIEKNPFSDPESTNKGIYALILLLLLVPLIAYIYMYKMKKKQAGDRNFMSIIKPQRKKDIDEVPLSENEPTNSISARKSSTKQTAILPVSATYVLKTKFSKPIKIIDFEIYVKRAIETGELEKQHENFPRGQTKPWEYGSTKANKAKNRYNNLIAYDHTRVKLAKIDGNEYSDYINANYIDGYRVQKAYIATQGPKSTTLNDFWRMIWQENVKNIVMLANITEGGKKKVEKYWPSINEETDFNGIRVQYMSSKVYANYEYRVFKVHKKNEQRELNQLHFTSWPDHGVPLYSQSLVPFLQQMLKIPNNPQSPVVVHCSAGVGRTGTIILCDICLRMAAGEGSIDFLANLEHLRSQRPNMVDNVEQYKLAHLVVLECLFGMHTSVPCDENMNKAIKKILSGDSIANQLRYLSDTEWEDRAMDTIWSKNDAPIYPEKNRFKDITPDKNYQISLRCYPYTDESSSYINAVQVDGFRSPGRYIVSQQPLPNTVGDFWRMVWERQCTVIISLNEIDPKEKSSCQFWPKKGSEMTPVDYLNINCVNNKVFETYQITTIEIINRKENESMQVKIVAMRNWMPDELLPSSIENYFLFWEECDILSRKSDTVIVTCYDGATASGLYIASTFLIDKMKLEQECDVCLAVRTIRHNRKQFVTNEEQFKFLYQVALMYIEGFQSYANFS